MRAAAMRTPLLAVCLLALATARAAAQEQACEEAPARPRRPAAAARPAPPSAGAQQDRALLRQLAAAQRGLGEQMQQMNDPLQDPRTELARQKAQDVAAA